MVRQYIGARYVTKIYENSLDPSSAEWEAGVTYEPLTMVTYLNSSYLSKKAVPGSVGDPAANPSYWVVTGAYNGQIAQLQNDVQELQQASATHEIAQKDRKYILIFDSFGALGVSAIAEQACTGGYHTLNVGGAGFSAGSPSWPTAFATYVASLTPDECAEYTDVMIFGGVNDYAETETNIINGMTAINTTCQTYMPQVRVTVCPDAFPTRLDGTIVSYMAGVLPAYLKGCTTLGWRYINGLNAFIHNDQYISSDGIHPTATGATRLGNAIKDLILTENLPVLNDSIKTVGATPEAAFTSASQLKSIIASGNVIMNGFFVFSSSTPQECLAGTTNALKLATLSNSDLFGVVISGVPTINISTTAYVHDTDSGTWVLRGVTFQIYYGMVYLNIQGPTLHFDAIQTPTLSISVPLDIA